MTMLRDLVPDAALDARNGARVVAGVAVDSRKVRRGDVFFAVPGAKMDGAGFAAAAAQAGASAIVAERAIEASAIPTLVVPNVRVALARAAAAFYPRQPATIVAVTGTSGKTSTASFVRQIWAHLGATAAMLGTTGVVKPSGETYGSLTTPDPLTLHATLQSLADEGVTHCAMEASSHGLDQHRLDGVRLAAAAFTNLSRDHLDYHPDLAHYLDAKMRLFEALLQPGQPAVIAIDTDVGLQVAARARARGLRTTSVGAQGDIRVLDTRGDALGCDVSLTFEGRAIAMRVPLAAAFMVGNALLAAGLCIATGSEPTAVFDALRVLHGAPGRVETVGTRHGAPIIIDYAHKPDALEKVLEALRPLARGKLIVVFGCGGDRDPGKRFLMGEIASRAADRVIVTDDNPRSEDPGLIRAAVLAGAPGAIEIGDRAQAIAAGIALLEEGDVLVIAGKGHETGQIVGSRVLPFSDHAVVRSVLDEVGL